MFFFRLEYFHIFKLFLLDVLAHLNIFFLHDCFLKISEKPSKFSKSVGVVVDYADTQFSEISDYFFCYICLLVLKFSKVK